MRTLTPEQKAALDALMRAAEPLAVAGIRGLGEPLAASIFRIVPNLGSIYDIAREEVRVELAEHCSSGAVASALAGGSTVESLAKEVACRVRLRACKAHLSVCKRLME